jgi:adenosine deaminase
MKLRAAITAVVVALAVSARLAGAGDAAEAATARKFAALRTQPLALEAFLRDMPKGGDLHNHLSGSIYAESYLRWAAEDQLCLLVETFTIVAPPCDAAGRPAVSAVLQNSALYNDAIDAMSMRSWPAGVNGHHHFFQAFAKFGLTSANHVGDMLAEVTAHAAAEHVSYLELMVTPDGGVASRLGREAGWPAEGGTPAAMTQLRTKLLASGWGDVLTQTKQRLDGFEARRREVLKCGTSGADAGCLVTVRYIAQVGRAGPREEVFAQILAGFEIASSEPRVVALNLVQPEDDPTALRDFSLQMSMIAFLRSFYPNAHITLHAGELADGLVPPEALRFHIRESVRTGHASRIGHGAAAMQEDDPFGLMRELAAKKVLVEIALSSNDMILGVKGARHPLRTYLQYGVPVALVTDDYGVARSSHTLEWLKAVQEQGLDYLTIKRMVRNSIEYSFADAQTKVRLKQSLENAFHQFEQQETAGAPKR